MDKNKIKYLLKRYSEDKATKEEVEEMFQLLKHAESDEVLKALIIEVREENRLEKDIPEEQWNKMWNAITNATTAESKNFFSMTWVRIAAAAVIFFAIAGSAYLLVNKKNVQQPAVAANDKTPYKNDIARKYR